MSNYLAKTRNPETGKWEMATWIDNYFIDEYGVMFPNGLVYPASEFTKEDVKHEEPQP